MRMKRLVLIIMMALFTNLLLSCGSRADTMNDPLLIGNDSGHYIRPEYSPNGEHIAYVFNDRLYVIDSTGRHRKRLTGSIFSYDDNVDAFSWISDNKLAYIEEKSNDATPIVSLYEYNLATGKRTQIKSGLHPASDLSWNHIEQKLAAIVMDTSGDVRNPGRRQLFLLDLNESRLQQVKEISSDLQITEAQWLPDGENILFVQERGPLYKLNIKTHDLETFKFDSVSSFSICSEKKFLYRRSPAASNNYIGNMHVASLSFKTGSEKQIDLDMSSFDCSPDGKTIVYTTVGGPGKNQLRLYHLN